MKINIHSIYKPFITHFRLKRLYIFYRLFNVTQSTRILDIGGNPFIWKLAKRNKFTMPKITILNLYPPENRNKLPRYIADWVVDDGRSIPFGKFSFDIAFCNSVIEHLGDLESQRALANEIRRVAPAYFVETPNRDFFVEPHLIAPFIHWLPKGIQKKMIRNFTPWGLITRPSRVDVERFFEEIRLLTEKEIMQLFPDDKIFLERFMCFPKGIIVYKNSI